MATTANMNTVIYLGPSHAAATARKILEPRWSVMAPEPIPDVVRPCLARAVALLDASMRVRFDRAMLDHAGKLRVISTATTGADHIDARVLSDRGIPLLTLAGQRDLLHSLTPAAEHTWLLLMACARRLPAAARHVLDGQWRREEFPGIMLKGKTLGLIGCGRIGSWMARYATAFGMRVVGFDPFVSVWPDAIIKYDLDALVSSADFISMHVPLSDRTRGMIGEREFRLMKAGAVFINTSRGAVADEQALLNWLRNGHLGGAGLDVLDGEPAINDHPLVNYARQHDTVIITPHIGGFCPEAVELVVAHAAHRIANVLVATESTGVLA